MAQPWELVVIILKRKCQRPGSCQDSVNLLLEMLKKNFFNLTKEMDSIDKSHSAQYNNIVI